MSKEVGGMVESRRVQGARRATGISADGAAVGSGALAPGQRWSASRKRDVVLRLLPGELLDAVSREVGLEVYRPEAWNEVAPVYRTGWRLEKLAYRTPLEARDQYELRHAA